MDFTKETIVINNKTKICPCKQMICPCGCGHRYSGVCSDSSCKDCFKDTKKLTFNNIKRT